MKLCTKKAHAAIRADPEAKSKPAKEVTKKRWNRAKQAWAFLYIASMDSEVTPFLINCENCFLKPSSSSS